MLLHRTLPPIIVVADPLIELELTDVGKILMTFQALYWRLNVIV